jgi:hypothetical protein
MTTASLRSLVAAAVYMFAAAQLHAQPGNQSARSIETIVANADLVVVGKLVEIRAEEKTADRRGHEIVLAVEETLKQDLFTIDPYERLRVRVAQHLTEVQGWKLRGNRLLVADDAYAPYVSTVIELASGRLEVLTADFKLLRDPDAVLQAAKKTLQRMPVAIKRIHTFSLAVPREVVVGTKWEKYYGTGGHLRLSVPVDQTLQKRAQNYIDSDSYQKREEGVRALRYFKSDENVARVKRLLNDPAWGYLKRVEENDGVEVRWYGVRDEAFRTLTSWGADVEKPVIREEVRKQ